MTVWGLFLVIFGPILGQSLAEIEIALDWFRQFSMFKGQLKIGAKQSRNRLLLFCLNDECVGQANYRHP